MANENQAKHLVAVIGAGPAGIYAARQLATSGAQVILLNRDIKPGGLAEYGIYYNKYKMKEGLRKQFRQILEDPQITYLGNVTVGKDSGLSLEDLREMGFQAVMVASRRPGHQVAGAAWRRAFRVCTMPRILSTITTACRHSAHRPLKSGRKLPWWVWGM